MRPGTASTVHGLDRRFLAHRPKKIGVKRGRTHGLMAMIPIRTVPLIGFRRQRASRPI